MKLSDLEGLSPKESEEMLDQILTSSFEPLNSNLFNLMEKIREREEFYGMTTEDMLRQIEYGQVKETEELANWAIDYFTIKELSSAC
ncbi:MAG: hypothetical protein AAGA75_25005 [Cyanobacteria bacterium P01_E01_bin.6]